MKNKFLLGLTIGTGIGVLGGYIINNFLRSNSHCSCGGDCHCDDDNECCCGCCHEEDEGYIYFDSDGEIKQVTYEQIDKYKDRPMPDNILKIEFATTDKDTSEKICNNSDLFMEINNGRFDVSYGSMYIGVCISPELLFWGLANDIYEFSVHPTGNIFTTGEGCNEKIFCNAKIN